MKWLRRPTTPPKRTLTVLVLFILAGAIINVAVAWGCAWRFRPHSHKLGTSGYYWAGTGGSGVEFSAGVPMLALQGSEEELPGRVFNVDGFLVIETYLAQTGGRLKLPWHPLGPGFAINTVFYAGIVWVLFTAPGFVRRRIRVMRHRCPACGYLIGTSPVCTECGTRLRGLL